MRMVYDIGRLKLYWQNSLKENAMRVIRNGKTLKEVSLEDWRAKIVCKKVGDIKTDPKGCRTVLEVGFEDLLLLHYFGTHFKHKYAGVKCPNCQKYNAVGSLPDNLWKDLVRRKRGRSIFDGFDDRI